MRTLLIIVIVLVEASCGGSSKQTDTPAAGVASTSQVTEPEVSSLEAQKKTMAVYEAAWEAHDPQKAASAYREDAVIKMVGAPDASGREAIQVVIAGMFNGSEDSRVPFIRTFHAGNIMIGEWVWAGTHTGEMMGIPATGKPFGMTGVSVYQFSAEGLLQEARVYLDAGTLMSQLGVSPQPARAIQALPTGEPMETIAGDTADEQRNVAAAKKMLGAFESKIEADFLADFADDVAWDNMTQPTTTKGKEAAAAFFKQRVAAFPDATMTLQNVWGVGSYVICESTMTGTQKGALGPIPATNKSVNLHGIDIIEFNEDGKIVRGWSYGNSVELLMQLGLLNAGPPSQ